ncbi:MAG: hypothetical protein ABJL99_06390 [Aliishimia sp.]
MVDFRLTVRRDAKAAKAFLIRAIERVRLIYLHGQGTDLSQLTWARELNRMAHSVKCLTSAPMGPSRGIF